MRDLKSKNIFLTFCSVTLVLVVLYAGYLFLQQTNTNTTSTTPESDTASVDELFESEEEHQQFRLAQTLFLQGQFEAGREMLDEYVSDEDTTLSAEQQAYADYTEALSYRTEDPVKSVTLMQELVANASYPNQQKAYAVQHMFNIWSFYSIFDQAAVEEAIFAVSPYADFLTEAGNDVPEALRSLNDYALSFGSAPLSEAGIAWYDARLIDTVPVEEQSDMLRSIEGRLAEIDDYFVRNQDNELNSSQEPRIRVITALVCLSLSKNGFESAILELPDCVEEAIALNKSSVHEVTLGFRYAWTALAVAEIDNGASENRARPYLEFALENSAEYPGVAAWLNLINEDPSHLEYTYLRALADTNTAFAELLSTI